MSVESAPKRHEDAAKLAAVEARELSTEARYMLRALPPRCDRAKESPHLSTVNAVEALLDLQRRGLVGQWLGLTPWGRMVADAAAGSGKDGAE